MILWLPLQGFAAVAMPFCKHGFHASTSTHASHVPAYAGKVHIHSGVRTASDSDQHHAASAGTHHHNNSARDLACSDCGVCHLACSPVAPTSLSAIERAGAQSFTQFSPVRPPAFVPEQRTPPPLAAIV
jgi:hypothetical protein